MRIHNGQCTSYIEEVTELEPDEYVCDSTNTPFHGPHKESVSALITEPARSAAPIHLRVEVFIGADDA
jgi:hypothetical protein